MKLFPLVAKMFAHAFFSEHVHKNYKQMIAESKKSEFRLLDLVHHYTSGGKSVHS